MCSNMDLSDVLVLSSTQYSVQSNPKQVLIEDRSEPIDDIVSIAS